MKCRTITAVLVAFLISRSFVPAGETVVFVGPFAPGAGLVAPQEAPFRSEVCLNGRWQFQPVALPVGFRRGESSTPDLPAPIEGAWDRTAIKIPSPWNVNRWGAGRRGRDVLGPERHGPTIRTRSTTRATRRRGTR